MMRIRSITIFSWALLAALLMPSFSCKKKRDIKTMPYMSSFRELSKDAFTLVFLSNMEGYVEPCGCSNNPLGGLDRFINVLNDVKSATNNNVALIDTGNLLFESMNKSKADICQEDAKNDLLLSHLRQAGLSKTISAGFDGARGESFQNTLYQKYGLSRLSNQEVYFIKAPSYEIGVLSVFATDTTKSRIDALEKLIKEAKAKPQLKAMVLISHMPIEKVKELFLNSTLVDVIIQAHGTDFIFKSPTKLSALGPLLVEGGRQGQYFTALLWQNLSLRRGPLVFDDRALIKTNREELLITRINALKQQTTNVSDERLAFVKKRMELAQDELITLQKTISFKPVDEPSVSFTAIALTKKIDPDPEVKKQLEAYEKSIPHLTKKCEENIECPKAQAGQATYVGAQACKGCHQEAFSVWSQAVSLSPGLDEQGKEITRAMGHSRAWKTLTDMDKETDRSCIGCHSVGFMQPGGYCKTSTVEFRKNVQCESCHGAGSLHAQSGDKRLIKGKVPEETCRSCHHVPHIQTYESFNYEERLIKILGKGHGEKLLNEIMHKKKAVH